jgi:hypothetical protein
VPCRPYQREDAASEDPEMCEGADELLVVKVAKLECI